MTTTALPTTGLDVIEALDFQPEIPCESLARVHSATDPHPADWWAIRHCGTVHAICESELARVASYGKSLMRCPLCDEWVPASSSRVLGPVKA